MVRNYTRQTTRGTFHKEDMLAAVHDVIVEGTPVRAAAKNHGVNYKTLGRYVALKRQSGSCESASFGYSSPRKVFSDEMEEQLVSYCIQASQIYYGLSPSDLRQLAYTYGDANRVAMPSSWKENRQAGRDWTELFMKRHADKLSVRTPEPTSLQRMACFNETNVNMFYDNLQDVMKMGFTPDRIYNCDETGVTTVQKPVKQIGKKGAKRVGSVVSQERGVLVTLCGAVNAIGNSIPPFLVFPRVHTQDIWRTVLPPGSVAEGHPRASGWMTTENFFSFLQHFERHARPTPEAPVLLLLDNHQSHISSEAITFCKDHSITLLSFPPHCSHELQPLDKTVYGPFKSFINQASDNWMRDPLNAGKSMTIHTIPVLISYAFPKAFTPTNIVSGFRSTGIYPFDRSAIPPEAYLPSFTTDRPEPPKQTNATTTNHPTTSKEPTSNTSTNSPAPSPSSSAATHDLSKGDRLTSPEEVRPFGKAAPRKPGQKSRKGKSLVYTSTPVKRALEEARNKGVPKKVTKTCRKKLALVENSSSESDGDENIPLESDNDSVISEEDDCAPLDSGLDNPPITALKSGDFILAKFISKRETRYYVGQIESLDEEASTADVNFLRRKPSKENKLMFVFPEVEDAGEIPISDILLLLPEPSQGGTKRRGTIFSFNCVKLENIYLF